VALRISSPLFVGRTKELAAFEQLLNRANNGDGAVVTVAGEAGIGKSRLVAEFERRAGEVDALTLAGECVDLAEGELAFAPIVAALRPVMEDVDDLEAPLRSTLAALWPSLGEPAAASREQLFEGVYRVLARLAKRQLVILVVEDMHWIDRSSRDLLAFLIRNARRDSLIVVATYRPDELHRGHPLRPFLAELERSGRAERLELEPLGRAELADQLAAISGARPPAAVVEQILTRSEGNPFYAEELLVTADSASTDELPGSLREALLLRLERLSPSTQDVLRAAAVVGRSVDHRLLGHISGATESDLLVALREATEQYLLVLTGRGSAYTFRHALLREAIYDDTLPGERLRLHRAIAEILTANRELATSSAAAELAYHWHAAGDLPAALGASLEAANEAERVYAYQECVRQIERALAMWDRVEAADDIARTDRVELLLRGSQAAGWAGDAERALMLGQSARDAVNERTAPALAATGEMRIGRALWELGRGDDAIEHLARARELVPVDPPSIERAEALAAEGRALLLTANYAEARERLEEARAMAAPLGSPAVEASVLNSLAAVYSSTGEYERGIGSGQEGLRVAIEHDLPEEVLRAYVNGSQALDDAGRLLEALEMGREGIAAARRLGMDRRSGDQARVQAAWRLARMGRFAEAERVLRPALEAATTPFNIAATKSIAGYLEAVRGNFDLGERLLDEGGELMQHSGGFQLIGPNQAWTTTLHLWRGELDEARERVADALERFAVKEPDLIYNAELYWLGVRVEAEAEGPSDAHALEILAAMDEAIAQIPGDGAPPEALAFRELAQAEFTRITGEPDPTKWRAAGASFRALDQRYRAAYADFRAAEALAQKGAPVDEIEQTLLAAHKTALEIGARPFQEEVEALAERTGVGLEAERPGRGRAPSRPQRMLATVLFTDIVGSTARAAELGDRQWRRTLDAHDQIVRREVRRHGGEVVQFVGDGTLSTFDSPARAIDCACALRQAVKPSGIELRAGVHTGEIELRGKDIGGIAVHIGARVAAKAGASEVLVSQTVADLVAGSGIQFEERGAHDLKGVPGRWRLYAVLAASSRASPAPV
jgi:class 3 adenylate cyclase